MAGEDKFNYIVRGIRKTGAFRPIGQLRPEDFHPVDDPNQRKVERIGDAFIEIFGGTAVKQGGISTKSLG